MPVRLRAESSRWTRWTRRREHHRLIRHTKGYSRKQPLVGPHVEPVQPLAIKLGLHPQHDVLPSVLTVKLGGYDRSRPGHSIRPLDRNGDGHAPLRIARLQDD